MKCISRCVVLLWQILRQRLIPDKFYSQPSSFRLVLLLSTENKVIIKNFAIFLYLAFKRRELLLREWWRDCIVTFVHFMFMYIHLHTVKILDIRVIAISYVPLNTLLKVQFATISITFVKATGQSNKLLRLCVSLSHLSLSSFSLSLLSLSLSLSLHLSLSLSLSLYIYIYI